MDLQALNSALPKTWLNPQVNNLTASTVTAGVIIVPTINASSLTLTEVVSVPNPTVGKSTIFVDLSGDLKSTDALGNTSSYLQSDGSVPMAADFDNGGFSTVNLLNVAGNLRSTAANDIVSNPTTSTVDNIPKFSDSTGKVLADSKVSVESVVQDQITLDGVVSETDVIAPRGQRDSWLSTAGAPPGSYFHYVSFLDVLISTANNIGASYSTDGGVTWNACIFDVPPVDLFLAGSGGGTVVLVAFIGTNQCYTSVDGINFILGPPLPTTTADGFFIGYFNGLFIAGINASPTQRIMTSSDGMNWIIRNSPIQALTFADNGNVVVAVGSVIPYVQYSFDAINWILSPTPTDYCRAMTYSADRGEFLSIGYNTGAGYYSNDGMSWAPRGIIAPIQVNDTLRWVSEFGRYYLAKSDVDGNWSLWSTEVSTKPFFGTHLDGAVINSSLNYSFGYLPLYNRFFIGNNNSPYYKYSVARRDLKALSDNIRVRGYPVATCNYSTIADATCNNTVTETNISTATAVGSLFLQAAQPLGMNLKFDLSFMVSSAAGDTLAIRYKSNNTLLFTHNLTIPALAVNLPVNIQTSVTIRNGSIQVRSTANVSGVVAIIVAIGIVYNRSIGQTWSITGQWGAALSTLTVTQLVMDSKFADGA